MAVRMKIDIICQQTNLAIWINILIKFIVWWRIPPLRHCSKAKIKHSFKDLATRRVMIALFRIGAREILSKCWELYHWLSNAVATKWWSWQIFIKEKITSELEISQTIRKKPRNYEKWLQLKWESFMNSPWVACVVGQGWGRDDENVSLDQCHYFAKKNKIRLH